MMSAKTTNLTAAFALLCAGALAGSASAQEAGPGLDEIVALATGPCLFTESGDVTTPFSAARDAAAALGLMTLSDTDKAAMFGMPGQTTAVITAGVDLVTCRITLPPPAGDHDGFETVEAALDAEITARYPKHLESIDDDPSPHIDGHDWVVRTDANDHLAVVLDYSTERGTEINIAIQKKYD